MNPDLVRLQKYLRGHPEDLDGYMVMADLLEELGDPQGHVLRNTISLALFIAKFQRAYVPFPYGFSIRYGRTYWRIQFGNSTYCSVHKNTGKVYKATFRGPEGPARFSVMDPIDVWEKHVGVYGLHHLRDIR